MVGPNYKKPEIAMPAKFIEEKKEEAASSDCDLCQWWKQFNDPQLDALLAEALVANYDFRIALEKIHQARAQYRIERSYLWPEIDLNAVGTRSLISQNYLFGSRAGTSSTTSGSTSGSLPFLNLFQVGFDAIWELDFWGKFRRAKNAAHDQWEATIEEANAVLITVISEVAIDYVTIRALQQKIDLTRKKIEADIGELDLADVRFEAGLGDEIQVDTLLATLEADSATLPVLETSLKQTIYALAFLLGRQPESLATEFNEIKPIPSGLAKVPVGLPSDLLRRRPDVRQAERQLAAATEQIGVAFADYFPHISLTGTTFAGGSEGGASYGFQSERLNNLFTAKSHYWSVGPSIIWNLIDFGRIRANVAVQNSIQKQALLSYEQIVVSSLKDVESALVAYFEEQKRNALIHDQVIADLRALELTEDLYQAGLANESQVLEARKTVFDAESALVDSDQAVTSDLISLYKALGGNWECSYSP
jgi:NodT family efflux transporter outer membrane factor (OMF) lipoprotein